MKIKEAIFKTWVRELDVQYFQTSQRICFLNKKVTFFTPTSPPGNIETSLVQRSLVVIIFSSDYLSSI